MATKSETFWIIENGPSKFDLMVALFDGKQVFFTLREDGTSTTGRIGANLQSVRIEDEGRENLHLVIRTLFTPKRELYNAFYNSRNRKGHAKLA